MEHGVRDQHVCDLAAEFFVLLLSSNKSVKAGHIVCLRGLFVRVAVLGESLRSFQSHSVCTSGLDVFLRGIVLRPARLHPTATMDINSRSGVGRSYLTNRAERFLMVLLRPVTLFGVLLCVFTKVSFALLQSTW